MITAIMVITVTMITTTIHNYNSTRPPSKSYWVHFIMPFDTTSPETRNFKKNDNNENIIGNHNEKANTNPTKPIIIQAFNPTTLIPITMSTI